MNAILNVAFGTDNVNRQARLAGELLASGTSAALCLWTDRLPPGSPTHQAEPYGFKVAAFRAAQAAGYAAALWIDTRQRVTGDPAIAFARITDKGLDLETMSSIGAFCNDAARCLAEVTAAELARPLMAGHYIGIGLRSTLGRRFLDEWESMLTLGIFRGSRRDHRHDMTAGGIVMARLGIAGRPFDCNGSNGVLAGCHDGDRLKPGNADLRQWAAKELAEQKRTGERLTACRGCGWGCEYLRRQTPCRQRAIIGRPGFACPRRLFDVE